MENNIYAEIDSLLEDLSGTRPHTPEFERLIEEIMLRLPYCPRLYIALSREKASAGSKTAAPLISTKDRYPALYIFTSREMGLNWCRYYNHFIGGRPLLAEVGREPGPFRFIFPLALEMGAEMLMVNEGGSFVCLSLKQFVQINNMSAAMLLSEEETRRVLESADSLSLKLPELGIMAAE